VHEEEEQLLFAEAERLGESGGNCDLYFEKCERSFLRDISNLVEVEE
jgi:hypothetical protein